MPDCESAYLAQTRGPLAGRRIRLREARADFDGYIAELLSKALSQAQLDQPLTGQDRDRVLTYLRNLGALDDKGQYCGSSSGPDAQTPVALAELFVAAIPDFYVQTDWSSQPTMMQVAGGWTVAGRARLPPGEPHRLSRRRARNPSERTWRVGDLHGCQGPAAAR